MELGDLNPAGVWQGKELYAKREWRRASTQKDLGRCAVSSEDRTKLWMVRFVRSATLFS